MKTTSGKNKPAPQNERVVKIYGVDSRKIIAQISASSLRKALEEYFERTLSVKWDGHKIVGNTMQVFKKNSDTVRSYRALELYQEP